MEAVTNGGALAPVSNEVPGVAPDGAAPEVVQPTAEETPAAKPEAKSDDEPKGVAKRIKELTDRIKAAEERERRYLSMLERNQPQQQPAKSEDEPEKSLKDFNYDENAYRNYERARIRAEAEKAAKEIAERYRVEQEAMQRRAKYDERVEAFRKSVDDYDDVVTDSTPVSEGMADYLLDSDEAGALMYYLGNNPDEARKLYYMSPAKAGRELTKLEDRLVSERKKAAEKPVSKAPPPAPKIEGKSPGSTAVRSTDPEAEKLPGDEWRKIRERELAAVRKRG